MLYVEEVMYLISIGFVHLHHVMYLVSAEPIVNLSVVPFHHGCVVHGFPFSTQDVWWYS